MNPYRQPTPMEAEPVADARSAWEELLIYGGCVAFGVTGVVDILRSSTAVGGTTALAILVGSWGARALVLRAWRRRNAPV